MIKNYIKNINLLKRFRHTSSYSRLRQLSPVRQLFPIAQPKIIDDSNYVNDKVKDVLIKWPGGVKKPLVGLIRDPGEEPRWTKYRRFLVNNEIAYEFYNPNSLDWLESAEKYDVIIGIESCSPFYLEDFRRKVYILEQDMNKLCYPHFSDALLYEDKIYESCFAKLHDLPFIKTFVFYDFNQAMDYMKSFDYPIIHKTVPSTGSVGIEMIKNKYQCEKVIKQAFSHKGKATQVNYKSQKNFVYFQRYIPNDGYDIRVIVIGNMYFGYYRKALKGDFRASGMGIVEKRELPEEIMKIAGRLHKILDNPMIVVDFLKGIDNQYYIIEFSPICKIETPEQLHVDGTAGVYIFENDKFHFEKGRYWVHELALRKFFKNKFLAKH